MTHGVLTLATTKAVYFGMAINLARSFVHWNDLSRMSFTIVTDLIVQLPADLAGVNLVHLAPGLLGSGFTPKLHLDRIAPAQRTLFIDADCLCMGDLEPIFERFRGRAVSVIGGTVSHGEWFGDVAAICARFSVPALPKFNGGVYYLEPGPKAQAVYDRARGLEKSYDELGLVRLRGRPNDELLLAIAMAVEGCEGIPDDGAIVGDLFSCPEIKELDVLSGRCRLRNPPAPDPQHRDWFAIAQVEPRIVHFLGHHVQGWRYRNEVLKLLMVSRLNQPPALARLLGMLYATWFRSTEQMKAQLRPIFHRLFGTRKIKAGVR
jgi:hypothetical protein